MHPSEGVPSRGTRCHLSLMGDAPSDYPVKTLCSSPLIMAVVVGFLPSRRSCHQQGMSAVGPIETPGLPPKASDLDEVRGAEVAEVCVHMILEQAEGKAGGEPERTKSSKSFVMNCIQYGSPVDGSAGRGFGKRVA